MSTLKTDGQNCDVLLLGLRNDYYLHLNFKSFSYIQVHASSDVI